MTTGAELWKQYQDYTRDFTLHARKLGLAGAAICWLFKNDQLTFPPTIYFSLLFFVLYFLADISHLLGAALTLRRFIEKKEAESWEAEQHINIDVNKPRSLDMPATICFYFKAVFLILGYFAIGGELILRLANQN